MQLYTTTDTQNEQTPSHAPAQFASPPEHALTQTEAIQEQPEMREQAAGQEQSEVVERLLAALEQNAQKQQKWKQTTLGVFMVCTLAFWAVWGVMWLVSKRAADVWSDHFTYVFVVNVIGAAYGALFLERKAAAELTTLDDIRSVGTLIDIQGTQGDVYHSGKTRRKAVQALTRLLPLLKASDAALLKEPQRVVLRGILASKGYKGFGQYHDNAFMLSILKAFAQIGDWKSVPHVQKLAQQTKNPELRAAALECLPFLQALSEKQKPGLDLLRASSASEAAGVAPGTLLRPVAGTEEARPDTLLRAAE